MDLRLFWKLFFCMVVIGVSMIMLEFFAVDIDDIPRDPSSYMYSMGSRHMPINYWRHRRAFAVYYEEEGNSTRCPRMPYAGDIGFDTPYWQRFVGEKFVSYLYTAYWERKPEKRITVLMLSNQRPENVYCHLWYLNEPGSRMVAANVTLLGEADPKPPSATEVQTAYSVHCILKQSQNPATPVAVSVVKSPICHNATNAITITNVPESKLMTHGGIYSSPPMLQRLSHFKTSVGVCVIWPNDKIDNTNLIAHWLEILRSLGAHRIYIAINKAHKRVHELFNFYEEHMLVLKLAQYQPSMYSEQLPLPLEKEKQFRRTFQKFIYTDCLYHARNLHNYVIMLKPFEVVLPIGRYYHWAEILEANRLSNTTSNAEVIDKWVSPGDDERSQEDTDANEDKGMRSFQRTDTVTLSRLEFPVKCVNLEGSPQPCLVRKAGSKAIFLPYTAVKECIQLNGQSGPKTECSYQPHEKLSALWYSVDDIARISQHTLYTPAT